jgi:hypothetical protein
MQRYEKIKRIVQKKYTFLQKSIKKAFLGGGGGEAG